VLKTLSPTVAFPQTTLVDEDPYRPTMHAFAQVDVSGVVAGFATRESFRLLLVFSRQSAVSRATRASYQTAVIALQRWFTPGRVRTVGTVCQGWRVMRQAWRCRFCASHSCLSVSLETVKMGNEPTWGILDARLSGFVETNTVIMEQMSDDKVRKQLSQKGANDILDLEVFDWRSSIVSAQTEMKVKGATIALFADSITFTFQSGLVQYRAVLCLS